MKRTETAERRGTPSGDGGRETGGRERKSGEFGDVGIAAEFTPSSAQRRPEPRVGDAGARSSGGQSAALIRPRPLVRVQARPPTSFKRQAPSFTPEGDEGRGCRERDWWTW